MHSSSLSASFSKTFQYGHINESVGLQTVIPCLSNNYPISFACQRPTALSLKKLMSTLRNGSGSPGAYMTNWVWIKVWNCLIFSSFLVKTKISSTWQKKTIPFSNYTHGAAFNSFQPINWNWCKTVSCRFFAKSLKQYRLLHSFKTVFLFLSQCCICLGCLT